MQKKNRSDCNYSDFEPGKFEEGIDSQNYREDKQAAKWCGFFAAEFETDTVQFSKVYRSAKDRKERQGQSGKA
jgi:hypothetical protein